jgi:hypothetical protein
MFKLLAIIASVNAINFDTQGVVHKIRLLSEYDISMKKSVTLPTITSGKPLSVILHASERYLTIYDFVEDCISAFNHYASAGNTVSFTVPPPSLNINVRSAISTYVCAIKVVPCVWCEAYDGRVALAEYLR